MRRSPLVGTLVLAFVLVTVLGLSGVCPAADTTAGLALEQGFRNPPDSAKPWTWWHWMNGNITKVGITRDLEAMKQVGLGGAEIFDVTDGILPGPVKYMSPEWREMVTHAVQEANRLGLELCIHNCAGWSSSGGPWNTPEHAMQMVVFTEQHVTGPSQVALKLPQPQANVGFYRDIAVLAFPTAPAEQAAASQPQPKVTTNLPGVDAGRLVDGNSGTAVALVGRVKDKTYDFLMEYPAAVTARGLSIKAVGGRGAVRGTLEVSDDGTTFRKVTDFTVPEPGITKTPMTVGFSPATGRIWRISFPQIASPRGAFNLAEITLEAGYRIGNLAAKAGFTRGNNPAPDTQTVDADAVVDRGRILDLTAQMDADGKLTWNAPAGDWTILRFGYTPTGKQNHPASAEGTGLECDKMSREAVRAHFAGMMEKVIGDVGPLAGKTLKHGLIDSYEVFAQNWTPLMLQEFQRRCGYDMLPFLPVMTGRVVGSLDLSERFLWDLRRTIADLFAENYFGYFAELLHQRGMLLSAEPYGNGNFDDITSGSKADLPMSEFWAGQGNSNQNSKLASSIAHTFGKKYVGAESFTADAAQGKWQNHPYSLKALGDLIYCGGVNRFIFHRYAHQPWTEYLPGMTMGPHGFHFERTITWWEQAPAWTSYLTRCQYLLQEGLFYADLCYFIGEGSPNSPAGRTGLRPAPPAGYDYDACNADVILHRMTVKDGRLVLPDGMSYRLLVLPESQTMSVELLTRIRDLVRDGATVIGPRPSRAPGLQGYPTADSQVQALAQELWGDCDGQKVTEHAFGKGSILWGKPIEQVLAARVGPPDFEYAAGNRRPVLNYLHRQADGADLYFVACQSPRTEYVDCTFRVAGKVPELWHPDTGTVERAPAFRQDQGRTTVPLRLDPSGSVFVVFRQPLEAADHLIAAQRNGVSLLQRPPMRRADLQIRRAIYGPAEAVVANVVDVTTQLSRMVRNATLTVRADNTLAGDPAQDIVKQLLVRYTYNGRPFVATVTENSTLQLPGKDALAAAQPGEKPDLVILKALYGLPSLDEPTPAKTGSADVTTQLQALVHDGTLSVIAGNNIAGDPAPMVVKQLHVEYLLDGRLYAKTYAENQSIDLPDGTEAGFDTTLQAMADLSLSADGTPTLTAWQPGTYEAFTAGGKVLRAQVAQVQPPIEIAGPWEVRFPPNWGAPEKATFDKLISWPESDDLGIKYFSGTATYAKQINIPAELLAPGSVLKLNLGVVHEFAQVRLNGRDLGILWKPPFEVDITSAAKAGANSLEVRITNLWPNRLIGDEQLPDDAEFTSGGPMKAWPSWLLEGKPRPATGRYTFTTWKHYHKDSPLLDSGLLGPVTLCSGKVLPLR
jgi:hypothetical protein